ncbi:MAG: hypothetical protein Q9159_003978 [Coniocarpon cinnabarinum]
MTDDLRLKGDTSGQTQKFKIEPMDTRLEDDTGGLPTPSSRGSFEPGSSPTKDNHPSPVKDDAPKKKRKLSKEHEINYSLGDVNSLLTCDSAAHRARKNDEPTPHFVDITTLAELRKQLKLTNASEDEVRALMAAYRSFGRRRVRPYGDNLVMHIGMNTPLRLYQLLGAAKLRFLERAGSQPRGGFLFDDMGLGKTLQMLTNMVSARGKNGDPEARKGKTLIIAGSNLLRQWHCQIDEHIKDPDHTLGRRGFFSEKIVREANGGGLYKVQDGLRHLKKMKIVFATYHEVLRSYEAQDKPPHTQSSIDSIKNSSGALHQTPWFRVVIDEAHHVKGYSAKTSQAHFALNAQVYWAITGTPCHNSHTECYSYFKLLRFPNTDTFKTFKHQYLSSGNSERDRVLANRMIRRTYRDKFLGAPIAEIPDTRYEDRFVHAGPVEHRLIEQISLEYARRIGRLQLAEGLDPQQRDRVVHRLSWKVMELNRHWLLAIDVIGLQPKETVEALVRECDPQLNEKKVIQVRKKIIQEAQRIEEDLQAFKAEDGASGRKRPKVGFSFDKWQKKGLPLLHSSKTREVMAQVHQKVKQDPLRKLLVFTQRKEIVRLLARSCKKSKVGHEIYTGDHSHTVREQALERFKTDPSKSVLIMTMDAGGEGLNLDVTTAVISMDLWWNRAREAQAHMRIIRMTQTKETEIIRIILEDSYDQKLLAMQDEKQTAIQDAMKGGKSDVERVLSLQGMVLRDMAVAEVDGEEDDLSQMSDGELADLWDPILNDNSDDETEDDETGENDEDEDDDSTDEYTDGPEDIPNLNDIAKEASDSDCLSNNYADERLYGTVDPLPMEL